MIASRYPRIGRPPSAVAMLGVALVIAVLPPLYGAALLAGITVVLVTLARPALGLALLAIAVPFGSVVEARTAELPVGIAETLAILVVGAWLATVVSRRADRVRFGVLVWPMLAFLGANLLAASFAEVPAASAKEILRWLELALVYVAAANLLRDRSSLRLVIGAVLVAGSFEAALGAIQFVARLGPPSFQVGRFLRAYGTFGQPNPFAGYLGMVLPLALALVIGWRAKRQDWLWRLALGTAALTAGAIGMSLSRGGWLGVGLAALVVAALVVRRGATILAGALGLAVVGALLNSFNMLPSFITQRLEGVTSYFRLFDAHGVYPAPPIWAIVERMAHWQAGWEMFLDHPFVGVGPGHYVIAYPDYAILPYWTDPLGHAHNVYINVAAESGLIGITAYVLMLASWLWVGIRLARRLSREDRRGLGQALAVGVVGCLVAASVHNVFDNLYVHGMNVHVGLLLGVVASVARGPDRRVERSSGADAIEAAGPVETGWPACDEEPEERT